jgi:dTDP-glucose pyrophosphorylase
MAPPDGEIPEIPEIVGLIPAAGRASRLGPLPCSKELLPLGLRQTAAGPRMRVACHELLERLRAGGVARAYLVIDAAKTDIPRFLLGGDPAGPALAYVAVAGSASVPETLDRAFPFVETARVALGFPDILFRPVDAFARLLERQEASGADLVLGLFPVERCETTDMVDCGPDGRVRRIEVRPAATDLRRNWLIAVWGPAFTAFLHHAVQPQDPNRGGSELQLGAVMAGALAAGLHVQGVDFPDGVFRDLGTPGDLAAALREGS